MQKQLALSLLLISLSAHCSADELSGTWKYEKSKEYFGAIKNVPAPKTTVVQIVSGKLAVAPGCSTTLKKQKYDYSEVFQSLLKEDVEEKSLVQSLEKNFAFTLPKNAYYSVSDTDDKCLAPFSDVFVADNKLVTAYGGSFFYSYTRSTGGTAKPLSPNVALYGHKLTQLPFVISNFMSLCQASIPRVKGTPQTTDICAPVYYPYTATKKDGDALTQLIWTHNYLKGGARHAEDYESPLDNKLHPTFMVLPPLKDVLLVRVDDFEPGTGEKRDTMSGAYLAIKDGKVTDQLNEGCDIDTEHYCVGDDGKKQYQLLETGKFKKLN
jgi:hypothetical protein